MYMYLPRDGLCNGLCAACPFSPSPPMLEAGLMGDMDDITGAVGGIFIGLVPKALLAGRAVIILYMQHDGVTRACTHSKKCCQSELGSGKGRRGARAYLEPRPGTSSISQLHRHARADTRPRTRRTHTHVHT
jgi:hypothetical protein